MIDCMNAQEIFNHVVKHLRKQGKKSFLSGSAGVCAYRGDGGLQCAVGCLINDDEYDRNIESLPASKAIRLLKIYRLYSFERLLTELQNVHDYTPVSDWENTLKRVGEEFGLTMPSPS